MKSIRTTILMAVVALMASATLTPTAFSAGTDKVTICHRGHTILVPEPLLASYLALGDTIGACQVTECQNR